MKEQPDKEIETNEWRFDLSRYGTANAELDPPAANDNSNGGFESLGNLSNRVLSRLRIMGAPEGRGRGR